GNIDTALRVRFWGVRGSYPTPGAATAKIGGNSSCVEIAVGAQRVIFDAGTGLIGLGKQLLREPAAGASELHIFLSHFHHDHIEGLRYFEPVYRPEWRCHIYGPGSTADSVRRSLERAMDTHFFPVSFAELRAQISLRTLGIEETVQLAGPPAMSVQARFSKAHPKLGVLLYRLQCGGRSVVYATDVEAPKGGEQDVLALARDADLLIHDSQYTDTEYFAGGASGKAGWGHSTVRMAAEIARAANVGQLV